MQWQEHRSVYDTSVNWTSPTEDGGMLECRYVRRSQDYFIAYVSSHSGCRQACRFCHLTQTGQVMFRETPIPEIHAQIEKVFTYYDAQNAPAERVNINFMARGEPLSSRELMARFAQFADPVLKAASQRMIAPMFNISSIFPQDAAGLDLVDTFGAAPVTIFWSLYALDPVFRRRWLRRAEDPEIVMQKLLRWQEKSQGKVVLHWALIEGENDRDADLADIRDFVARSGLDARLNLVRYNPHSEKSGREAEDARYEAALDIIGPVMNVPGSRIVPRVGYDVKASCGMFMGGSKCGSK